MEKYMDAANKLFKLSEQFKDNEKASKILKDGSLKIIEKAKKNGLIVKAASSVDSKEEASE